MAMTGFINCSKN